MVVSLFLYGPLRQAPLRAAVLGRALPARPARLDGWQVLATADEMRPRIAPAPGAAAAGVIVEAGEEERARLDYFLRQTAEMCAEAVAEGAGPVAVAFHAGPAADPADPPSPAPELSPDAALLATRAAAELMALWRRIPADQAARMEPQILDRAASRLRARRDPDPRGLRQGDGPVEVIDRRTPYRGYFEIVEADLRFPTFSGGLSQPVTRAAFASGDAVTVLPYDPRRDRVLLIEQFRFPPLVRDDPIPWTIEPVAGRIDGGEAPEAAALRECVEEAGLTPRRLIPVGRYYPSPGAVMEYIYSYLGIVDLPDAAAGGLFGMADEHEDIRVHLVAFDRLMQLLDAQELPSGPLLISVLELARRRDGLRAEG